MSKTYSEKQSRRAVLMAASILALAGVAIAMKTGFRALGVDDGGWLAIGCIVVGFAAVFLVGSRIWKGLDDMQRQGHATSWYWGGIGGLAVTALIISATGLAKSEFTLGVATLMVMQLACSLIFYAFWWLKGRGFSFSSGE
ncbi:hypothetical protein [Pontixanthobacter sp.]|uniref:hypothetical protein n=1 Tax=Pontixanthobacter sp. TaxID=2792078 RepID=UPI003C7C0A5D